jgi:hypothetical protein
VEVLEWDAANIGHIALHAVTVDEAEQAFDLGSDGI